MADLYERLKQIRAGQRTAPPAPAPLRDEPPDSRWERLAPAIYWRTVVSPVPEFLQLFREGSPRDGSPRDGSPPQNSPREAFCTPEGGVSRVSPCLMPWTRDRTPVFLDVETTGLSGGAGSAAFLVGCAEIHGGELPGTATVHTTQFFLADIAAERRFTGHVLARITGENGRTPGGPVLVTYNGASFDVPVLRTRAIMTGERFPDLPHLDVLPVTRRLFRRVIGACSLGDVERRVLHTFREQDVPGREVPGIYHQFLRGAPASVLEAVVAHHLADIVNLALFTLYLNRCLLQDFSLEPLGNYTAPDPAGLFRELMRPAAHRTTAQEGAAPGEPLSRQGASHRGSPQKTGEPAREDHLAAALQVLQEAVPPSRWRDAHFRLADEVIAVLRQGKQWDAILPLQEALFRYRGTREDCVRLAILYEHRRGQCGEALEVVREYARRNAWDDALLHRLRRLERRVHRQPAVPRREE